MANVDPEHRRASGRKLQKRARNLNRLSPSQIPARLRYGDDAHDDVTAPSRAGTAAPQYMNQSIFSMIAAAGSKTDFNKRFEESSDSEDGEDVETDGVHGPLTRPVDQETQPTGRHSSDAVDRPEKSDKKKKRLSGHGFLRALPKLNLKTSKIRRSSSQHDPVQSPTSDYVSEGSHQSNPRDAPMMSLLLTKETEYADDGDMAAPPKSGRRRDTVRSRAESTPATLLATRLMEIFGFEKPENVIAEYPCWLLQSVLLQGYLYLTKHHICFFAYLPKKSNVVAKTGYLSKRGRNNPSYKRFWFTLKGDVLSYFSDPSNVYFPHGNIDLRYAAAASLLADKDKKKECRDFSVKTEHRNYYFRADSAASAKEWVKSLQKAMFRSHNDGDSVKISLPIENIIDIEESPVVEFAETVKVRVIESGDSYAIDEYFFSFFSHGRDALGVLGRLIDDSPMRRTSQEPSSATGDQATINNPKVRSSGARNSLDIHAPSPRDGSPMPAIRENVRATIMPYKVTDDGKMSPRMSGEFSRPGRSPARSSMDGGARDYGRASFDRGRSHDSTSRLGVEDGRRQGRSPLARHQDSIDDYTQSSVEPDTESSAVPLSPSADARMSASQILSRSDVFRVPGPRRMDTVRSVSTGDNDVPSDYDTAPPNSNAQRSPVEDLTRQATGRPQMLKVEATTSDLLEQRNARNTPSPTLQELAGKVGAYPLARAGAFAKYISKSSSKMSRALATESMTYVEKVTGMWQGGHKHYGENEGIVPDDKDVDPEDEEANVGHGDRFRTHFALPSTEKLQATYFGFLHRVLPLYGKIYVSNRLFCFRSLLPGTRTKLVLPLKDVENVDKEKGFRFGYHGLVLVIQGHEELFFEFNSPDTRDDCTVTLLQTIETHRFLSESGLLPDKDEDEAVTAKAEHRLLQEARGMPGDVPPPHPDTASTSAVYPHSTEGSHILFDDPKASIINFRPSQSMRITCLTIGSRGDVQPYIALCKGLLAEGHRPRIATHAEFGPWVEKYGIEFSPIGGDPAELMRICVENGMFTYSFLREASTKFRSWIDDLLSSAWAACQDSDLLIESPSAMAGIHIAEALNIPYFRAFTMPWTRTRAYPHAFAVPEHKIGGAYNYFSYVMFDNVFWKGIAGQVNRWRKKELGLHSTNLDKMQPNKVPFLYNFSPHVVAPPLDYSDWVRVTGYWFLDESSIFTPPDDLRDFIKRARDDGKKLVYIGFGSIVVSDPAALTKTVVDSVLKADVRCILSKGWSDRLGDPTSTKTEVPLPQEIFQIKSAPHDWLFPQVDAAVHHGGAGTTGASLRAGVPTIIKPFFGDQFFFGGRVEDLGVGILLRKINVSVFARALWEACHSERMRAKAKRLGEKIREENGVATAIQAIYRDLEYAKTLIRARQILSEKHNQQLQDPAAITAANMLDYETEAGDLEGEESWTFIGDENEVDAELRKRMNEAIGTGTSVSVAGAKTSVSTIHGPAREQPRVSLDLLRPTMNRSSSAATTSTSTSTSTIASPPFSRAR